LVENLSRKKEARRNQIRGRKGSYLERKGASKERNRCGDPARRAPQLFLLKRGKTEFSAKPQNDRDKRGKEGIYRGKVGKDPAGARRTFSPRFNKERDYALGRGKKTRAPDSDQLESVEKKNKFGLEGKSGSKNQGNAGFRMGDETRWCRREFRRGGGGGKMRGQA